MMSTTRTHLADYEVKAMHLAVLNRRDTLP